MEENMATEAITPIGDDMQTGRAKRPAPDSWLTKEEEKRVATDNKRSMIIDKVDEVEEVGG